MGRVLLIAIAFVACPAHAETYKCTQRDGSASYQDRPCESGAKGSTLALPATGVPGAASNATPTWKEQALESDRQRIARETKARNDEALASNRAQRCQAARQRLGALKEAGSVYRRDNAGERRYLSDKERRAEVDAAQSAVAESCS